MNKLLISILILVLMGCKKDNAYLSSDLYNIIINYQNKVPIPSEKEIRERTPLLEPNKAKYIYQVTFDIKEKDTVISIQLENGILTKNNRYGEYYNSTLKPVIIVDEKKIGKKFVKKYVRENIENYVLKSPPTLGENYPLFRYTVNNNELELRDSIRGNTVR